LQAVGGVISNTLRFTVYLFCLIYLVWAISQGGIEGQVLNCEFGRVFPGFLLKIGREA